MAAASRARLLFEQVVCRDRVIARKGKQSKLKSRRAVSRARQLKLSGRYHPDKWRRLPVTADTVAGSRVRSTKGLVKLPIRGARKKFTPLATRARELEKSLPRGESWFRKRWSELGMRSEHDGFNVVFQSFILDVYNPKYRYAIEIDGAYHGLPEQQRKDARKDYLLEKAGLVVFRVRDFQEADLRAAVEGVRARRQEFPLSPGDRAKLQAQLEAHRAAVLRLERELGSLQCPAPDEKP